MLLDPLGGKFSTRHALTSAMLVVDGGVCVRRTHNDGMEPPGRSMSRVDNFHSPR
jgi:hypothetical protein